MLPYPDYNERHKLAGIILQCARPYFEGKMNPPPPNWVQQYKIPGEDTFDAQIADIDKSILDLDKKKQEIQAQKEDLLVLKGLIYEQGKPLEAAVIKALDILGFVAGPYQKGDMDHDVIIECAEGRAICEVEGRDNDAIHVNKLDQLSRVVDEDACERGSYSHGILIGNPYRLTELDKRADGFTEKIRLMAARKKFGLLSTVELYYAVITILKDIENEDLKRNIRQTILNPIGMDIKFFK